MRSDVSRVVVISIRSPKSPHASYVARTYVTELTSLLALRLTNIPTPSRGSMICRLTAGRVFFVRCVLLMSLAAMALVPASRTIHAQSIALLAYPFSDGSGTTTADASGNAHTATLANGPTWTSGFFGAGLTFDGNDDELRVDVGSPPQRGSSFTFQTWAHVTPTPLMARVVTRPNSS
jgi:hypothetical protein